MPSHAKHAAALGLALAFLSAPAEGSYLTQLRGRRLDGSEDDGQDIILTNSDVAPDLSLPSAEVNFMASPGGAKASKALSFSMSLPSKSAKADMMEGKASKADLSYSLSMPSKSGKGAKAEATEPGAKSVKSSKSDLSFSLSVPGKSAKSEPAAKASKAEEDDDGDVVAGAKSVKAAKAILGGSLSMSMGEPEMIGKASKAEDGAAKSAKSELSFSMSLPSKSAKADAMEGGAKSSKSDLSFSLSMPSKSGKSAGDERPAKASKAESEEDDGDVVAGAKSVKSAKAIMDGSLSLSMPSGKAEKAMMEGGKASKSDLSFSLPSKSSKSELSFSVSGKSAKAEDDARPAKAAKADLSFSVSAKSAKAESAEPPVTTVPPVPGGKASKAIDPDMMMQNPAFLLDEGSLSMSL